MTGGLVVTSVDQKTLNTSTFDNVTIASRADWEVPDFTLTSTAGSQAVDAGSWAATARIRGTSVRFEPMYLSTPFAA